MKSWTVVFGHCIFLLIDFSTAVQFNVSGITGSINEFACNERAILQCKVNHMTDPVLWQIGNPVLPSTDLAARCSGQSCMVNPTMFGAYNFSYDENSGISNLTIFNVTSADDGMQYKCDDGSSPPPAPFVGIVQDLPKTETSDISIRHDLRNGTSISVKTGCVSPGLFKKISFNWIITKDENSLPEDFSANTTTMRYEAPCLTIPVCIRNGSAQIFNSFTIEEDEASPRVFFQAQVIFNGNILFVINSRTSVRIKAQIPSVPLGVPSLIQECDKCWIILVCFVLAARVLFLQAWLPTYCLCKTKQDDECISFLGLILGIFFPGLGILFIGLKIVRDGWKDKMLICGLIILASCFVVIEIILLLLCFALDVGCLYLYIVGAVYLLSIDVCDGCINFYVVFKSGKESESSVSERPPMETNTNISSQPQGKDGRYTCDGCRNTTSIKNYCMECHKFLCDSCNSQHTCDGIRLRHLQHEGSNREEEFRCDNHKKQTIAAHGYCLTCSMYLCTKCLINHHKDQHNLLWIPHNDGKLKDGLCCYRGHTDRKDTTNLGYCKQCKIYVCTKCAEKHKEHPLVLHHEQGGDFENCKKCESIAECFHLNNRNCLCSDCYEHGDFPVNGSALGENFSEVITKQQKCMLHDVFGDGAAHYSTDVYCLKCRVYLCTSCFKHHRRIKEYWIRTHKSNLFTCKKCQAERNVFPVECLMLDPIMLLCAECFESSDIYSTDIPVINDAGVREALHKDLERPCQLHTPPFHKNDKHVRSSVYCLVCKTYMCKECFQSHRRLRNIMKKVAEEKLNDTHLGRRRLLTSIPKRHQAARKERRYKICIVICGFIPIFGVLFIIAFCRMEMNDVEPATEDESNSSEGNRSNSERL